VTVLIRTATAEDIPSVVRVHQSAFPRFFLSDLGPRFLTRFYVAFIADARGVLLVAVDHAASVVGLLAGTSAPATFFPALRRGRGISFVSAALPYLLRHPWRAGERMIAALRYRGDRPPAVPADYWLLSSLAVATPSARRGIGGALVARFCDDARDQGAHGVYLLTDRDDNDDVQRFYHKQLFTVHDVQCRRDGRHMSVLARRLTQ